MLAMTQNLGREPTKINGGNARASGRGSPPLATHGRALRQYIRCAAAGFRGDRTQPLHCTPRRPKLLGIQPLAEKLTPSVARLRKRLRKVEVLPPEDQEALLTLVDTLLERRGVA